MNSEPLSFWRRILRVGADHPRYCATFLLVASIVAAFGLSRVTVDTRFESLMAKSEPDRQAYLEVARQFGSDRRAFLYVRDEQLWSPAKLAALERLHDQLRQLPFVERVDDIFTLTTVRGVDGQLTAQPLLTHAPADDHGAESARARVLEDPIAVRNLVGADGMSLAIGISIREPAQRTGEDGVQVYDALERLVAGARAELPSLVQVGPQRIQAEMERGIGRELMLLGPLSALALAIFLFSLGRNVLGAATALATASVGLLWTFGMMGFAGMPLTVLSVLLPPLVMALNGTETVYLLFGGARAEATPAGAGVRNLGGAPVITALTLILGFACQAFSGVEAVGDFGLAAAFAVMANWLATVLLLPMLERVPTARLEQLRNARIPQALAGASAHAMRLLRSRAAAGAFALAALAGALAVFAGPDLRVAHDPLAFFHTDSALVQASERMHEDIAGPNILYITLDANAEGAFRDPANLRRLADIQAFISKQHIFDRSLSLADIVSRANREAAGGRSESYEVPPTRQLVGQYLVLHRPQDLEPYVSHDFRRANIVVRHNVRDSAALNRHIREMQSAIAHYAGPAMTTAVLGQGALVNAAADRLLKTEAAAVAAMLAFVLIATALMFTSAKGGIAAMALSALPLLGILGAIRVLEIPLGAGAMAACVIAIAITIQGTSRLFARYSDLCRNASTYDDAAAEALRNEAAPMLAACLALFAGFGVLLFSMFLPILQFGLLACTAAGLACLVNFVIAPAVLSRIRLVGLYDILALSSQREALVGCALFSGLSSYQIRKTILISELREYRDSECLIEQGSVGRCMYVILGGQVEVVRHGEDGNQRLAVLNPGDVFGEIGYVRETYRTADVRALGAVSALRFDHNRLKKDLLLFPHIMAKLNFNISGILGKRLAELVEASRLPSVSPTLPAVSREEN